MIIPQASRRIPALLVLVLPFAALAAEALPEIVVDRADSGIFPGEWVGGKIDASAEPLTADLQIRGRAIIDRALAKYPDKVLKEHLGAVYAVARLRYSGVVAGGTNSSRSVYMVVRSTFSGPEIERIFHAEFSSILFRNRRDAFDEAAWRKQLPEDFRYGASGVQAIRDGTASTKTNSEGFPEGFLSRYSRASIEEDFNSYASRLFLGDPAFWQAVDGHPVVREKARLVISFYHGISADFDEDWFRSLVEKSTSDE